MSVAGRVGKTCAAKYKGYHRTITPSLGVSSTMAETLSVGGLPPLKFRCPKSRPAFGGDGNAWSGEVKNGMVTRVIMKIQDIAATASHGFEAVLK